MEKNPPPPGLKEVLIQAAALMAEEVLQEADT